MTAVTQETVFIPAGAVTVEPVQSGVLAFTGTDEDLLNLADRIRSTVTPDVECPECDGTGYVWACDRLGEGRRGCKHCKRTGRVAS